jgi:hypothetical protein
MTKMTVPKPGFDRFQIKSLIDGRRVVSYEHMLRILANCLQKIDEQQAIIDEFMEEEEEQQLAGAELMDEGYVNDKE